MTPTQKIIALTHLDGWTIKLDDEQFWRACRPDGTYTFNLWLSEEAAKQDIPPYLTSHDALQPLLEKMTEEEWTNYFPALAKMTGAAIHSAPLPYEIRMHLATPEQKSDCILKACGKWKEQGG